MKITSGGTWAQSNIDALDAGVSDIDVDYVSGLGTNTVTVILTASNDYAGSPSYNINISFT